MMMMIRFVKSRVSGGFSRRALEPHTTLFSMWIGEYWPVAEFLGSFYTDHLRFDLFIPT